MQFKLETEVQPQPYSRLGKVLINVPGQPMVFESFTIPASNTTQRVSIEGKVFSIYDHSPTPELSFLDPVTGKFDFDRWQSVPMDMLD